MNQWTELIRQCQASGMKVNAWCAVNSVTHDAYYYWFRKLRKATMKQTGTLGLLELAQQFQSAKMITAILPEELMRQLLYIALLKPAKANGLNEYTYLEYLLMYMPDTVWHNHPENWMS